MHDTVAPARLLLSLQSGAAPLRTWPGYAGSQSAVFLSGPEGGFSPAEEALALGAGFTPHSLGARTLRAETAALVALAQLV
jgi:16S rRNA (uracil1498-N3)-methyltransferase